MTSVNGHNSFLNYSELSRLIKRLESEVWPAWAEGRIHAPPGAEYIAETLVILHQAGQDGGPASELAEVLGLDVGSEADRERLVELVTEAIGPIESELTGGQC